MKEIIKEKAKKIRKYTSYIFLFIVVLIMSYIYLDTSPMYKNIISDIDSSVFQVMGKGLLENKILYKDLFDHKGPIVYIINALAFLISNKYGLFIMEIIIAYVGTIFIYKTSRIILGKDLSMITSIIYVLISYKYFYGGNFTEEYAITFISIAMYYIIRILHIKEDKKLNWIMIGITFAITFLIKPTYCTIWAVFGIVQFICSIYDKKIKELIKAVGYMLAGILIISIPIIIYLLANGAWDTFIDAYFLMNIKYSESTIMQKINGLIQLFKVYKYNIYLGIMIISNFIILISKKINKRTKIFVTLFFIISTILTGWSPTSFNHYLIQLAPCFALEIAFAIYIIREKLNEENSKCNKIFKELPLKFIYSAITIITIILIGDSLNSYMNFMKFKDYYYEMKMNEINEIKKYICKEDEILVLGNNSYYYLLFDIQPEFRYFFQYPIIKYDEKIKNEIENYIIEKKPKVIIDEKYKNHDTFENETFEQIHGEKVVEELEKNYEEHSNKLVKYYILRGEE